MYAGKTEIPVSHGRLEAIYRPDREDAERVALVLHPHPVYGGTMHNPVVFHCAKALEAAGYETLRFNFRGVGESTGTWDEGRGEYDDARDALAFLLAAQPNASDVLVAGYSFGSAIGMRLGCESDRVARAIAIAMPIGLLGVDFLASCRKPKLFVHGSADELAPLAPLQDLVANGVAPPVKLEVIEGASHFFESGRDELVEAIHSWAAEHA